jgi:hypothetical protein
MAKRAAGKAAIGDETHILGVPLANERRGRREHFAHSRATFGTFVADHDDVAGIDPVRHDRIHRRGLGIEHRGPGPVIAGFLSPVTFATQPSGCEICRAGSRDDLPLHRIRPGPDHFLVGARRFGHILQHFGDRLPR